MKVGIFERQRNYAATKQKQNGILKVCGGYFLWNKNFDIFNKDQFLSTGIKLNWPVGEIPNKGNRRTGKSAVTGSGTHSVMKYMDMSNTTYAPKGSCGLKRRVIWMKNIHNSPYCIWKLKLLNFLFTLPLWPSHVAGIIISINGVNTATRKVQFVLKNFKNVLNLSTKFSYRVEGFDHTSHVNLRCNVPNAIVSFSDTYIKHSLPVSFSVLYGETSDVYSSRFLLTWHFHRRLRRYNL